MSVSLSKAMEKQIMDAARAKAKELAVEARKSIKNEYIRMIREFYAEQVFVSETGATTNYPRYYDRNFNYKYNDKNILISGLGHTFKDFDKSNKNKTVYIGGINISTKYMINERYRGTYDMVLSSFLRGWHGLPSEEFGGIPSKFVSEFNTPIGQDGSIWRHMIGYRNNLKKELAEKFTIQIG